MPIYEYACGKCEHEFEVEQRISDPPVKTCPECRSRKVKRLISRTSFVLKGSGWYADLYSSSKPGGKGGGSADRAEKGEGGGDKKGPSGGGGSGSKDASKSESKSGGKATGKPKAAA